MVKKRGEAGEAGMQAGIRPHGAYKTWQGLWSLFLLQWAAVGGLQAGEAFDLNFVLRGSLHVWHMDCTDKNAKATHILEWVWEPLIREE